MDATARDAPPTSRRAPSSGQLGAVAAFFDIDNTVIRGASAFHLAGAMRRRGLVSTRALAHLAWRSLRYQILGERKRDIDATRAAALAIIKGISVAEILVAGEQLYDEVLALRIFPGTKELIDKHREAGHEVWFVSGSPVEVGSLLAARLGATGALGTQAERVDGFYTGRLIGDLLHGQAKADSVVNLAASRSLDLGRSFAYSDSINDAPLLTLVGNPCGINPDRRLRSFCAEHSWPVREFRDRRRAVRRSLRAATNVGAWWAASTIVWAVIRRLAPRRRVP